MKKIFFAVAILVIAVSGCRKNNDMQPENCIKNYVELRDVLGIPAADSCVTAAGFGGFCGKYSVDLHLGDGTTVTLDTATQAGIWVDFYSDQQIPNLLADIHFADVGGASFSTRAYSGCQNNQGFLVLLERAGKEYLLRFEAGQPTSPAPLQWGGVTVKKIVML